MINKDKIRNVHAVLVFLCYRSVFIITMALLSDTQMSADHMFANSTTTSSTDLLNSSIMNTTEEPPYMDFYDNAQFVTGLICYPIICLIGLTGNILIVIVLAQKSMATSTNVYLSALAIGDIIKLINDLLYFLTVLLVKVDPISGNKMYGYLYPYAHFIFNMSVCVSSWLTVSVAAERYILVCHPTQAISLTTIPRAKIITTVCFIFMTAIAIPSALRYRTVQITTIENGVNTTMYEVELTDLWKNDGFVTAYTWTQSLLRSIIPLVILVIMNAFIIRSLRQTRANKKLASRNKITIMLIIVIIFFLCCITPDAVMSAFFNFGYTESENYLVKGVREITDMLLGVNAAMNFILYMIFNQIFRDQFLSLFCNRCVKAGWCASSKDANKKKTKTEDTKYSRLSDKPPANGVQTGNGESHV